MDEAKEDLLAAARELGRKMLHAGDTYDVVEQIAKGYAEELSDDGNPGRQMCNQIGVLHSLNVSSATVRQWRVDDARAAGASWADIGRTMDMSKQGAQQRYGGQADTP